jgi:hypothetical protein
MAALPGGALIPGSNFALVGQVEVVLPGGAIVRFLSTGMDIAILAESAGETLEKARRLSPFLPRLALQAHLVHSGYTPVVKVEHRLGIVHFIAANDRVRVWGAGSLAALARDQKIASLLPFERGLPM